MRPIDFTGSDRYPLAIGPLIERAVSVEGSESALVKNIRQRVEKLPGWAYRPLPRALEFHKSLKRFRICLGGNRCLGPDALIEGKRVADIKGEHEVWAWNGRYAVKAKASEPWIKGFEPCYRVTLSNGQWFDCSMRHRFWNGRHFCSLAMLLESGVFRLPSTSGIGRSTHVSDAPLRRRGGLSVESKCHASCIASQSSDLRTSIDRQSIDGFLDQPQPSGESVQSANQTSCYHESFSRFHVVREDYKPCSTSIPISSQHWIPTFASPQSTSELHQSAKREHCADFSSYFISFDSYAEIISAQYLGVKPIYDFEVEEFHNYFAAGVLHHNSSKSRSGAQEAFWFATGTHPFRDIKVPNEGWSCALTWEKVGDTLWPALRECLTGYEYNIIWHNKQRDIPDSLLVKVKSGYSKISFKAYEQGRDVFQSVSKRWIDNDEQFPQDIFIEQLSRIGAGQPLDFWAKLTPIVPQPWFEQFLTIDRPPEFEVFEFPLDDNRISAGGFIDDGLIDSMIDMWPPEVRDTRRLGKWGAFSGTIYQTFARDIHIVDEAKERRLFFPKGVVPPTLVSICSHDWGGANPDVHLWMCVLPDGTNYLYDEYYWDYRLRGQRTWAQHAKEIKDRTQKWQANVYRTWADHDPSNAREMSALGVPSQPANKDVWAGIEEVQRQFNPRMDLANADFPKGRPQLLIAARCKMTIKEVAAYRRADGTEKRDSKEEPLKKDDHSADALRYAVFSERKASGASKIIDTGDRFKNLRLG